MSWWLWTIIGMAGFAAFLLLFSKITIHTYYSRVKENDRFFLGLRVAYGIFRYRYEIPVVKFKSLIDGISMKSEKINEKKSDLLGQSDGSITQEKIIKYYEKGKLVLQATLDAKQWFIGTLSHVHCTELKWDTRIGLGDAPDTAITTGIVWSLKSSLLSLIFRYVNLDTKPRISVTPQYNQTHFSTEISCITKIRLGQAMIAGLLLLVRILKVKGGIKVWQSILSKA